MDAAANLLLPAVAMTAASGTASASDVIVVLGWILGLVLVGAIAIYLLRRWVKREMEPPVGFSLEDLRQLRDAGEITDVEYNTARDRVIAHVKRQAVSKPGGVESLRRAYTSRRKP